MTDSFLRRRLLETSRYDMSVHSTASTDNGWKISIQGKCVEDSVFLYNRLSAFLNGANVPYKVATIRRYELINKNREQSHKAMTIYCPNDRNFSDLCESVYSLIKDYTGWHSIKNPSMYEHYAGGLFVRNDRDANGQYIPAIITG